MLGVEKDPAWKRNSTSRIPPPIQSAALRLSQRRKIAHYRADHRIDIQCAAPRRAQEIDQTIISGAELVSRDGIDHLRSDAYRTQLNGNTVGAVILIGPTPHPKTVIWELQGKDT